MIGGVPGSEAIYVTPDASAVPLQVLKVTLTTGLRQPFVIAAPKDPAGVVLVYPPIFTPDEKQYIYTQLRDFSVLYLATGLKQPEINQNPRFHRLSGPRVLQSRFRVLLRGSR